MPVTPWCSTTTGHRGEPRSRWARGSREISLHIRAPCKSFGAHSREYTCAQSTPRLQAGMMLSLRLLVLFFHVTAVIVALGGSLFSTFALTPVLAEELDPPAHVRVARRVVLRLGVIVLSALAILVI